MSLKNNRRQSKNEISSCLGVGSTCKELSSNELWIQFLSTKKIPQKIQNLPSDKPPALEESTTFERFYQHLNALHSARRAYIQAESSKRIRRALRHQIRASSQTFETGDTAFYKRDTSNKWKAPDKVIGQDDKTIFVRHRNTYVRVPSCHLLKVGQEFRNENEQKSTESKVEVNDEITESGPVVNEEKFDGEFESPKQTKPLNTNNDEPASLTSDTLNVRPSEANDQPYP